MTIRARRAARHGGGRSPELVATILTIVAYGLLLVVGPALRAGGGSSISNVVPAASEPTVPPRASVNPLLVEIEALLEIDARLTSYRKDLHTALAQKTPRGSDLASAMRRINSTLALGPEHAARLSNDPTTREVGSRLEVLYASAATTTTHASDLAIGNDEALRQAAQEIFDLFIDLPAIDATLKRLQLAPASAPPPPSASPSFSPSGVVSPSPGTGASSSPVLASPPNPMERLRDPGFDRGLEQWALVLASPVDQATASADRPLGDSGTASLRLDITATDGSSAAISVKEDGIAILRSVKYAAQVTIRSSVTRPVQIRLVGPNEELYGLAYAEVGPASSAVSFETYLPVDEPNATFRVDIAGLQPGQVWLDDASLTERPPG